MSQVPGGGGDSQLAVVVTGVESEEVEEINDAYNDIMEELGDDWWENSINVC